MVRIIKYKVFILSFILVVIVVSNKIALAETTMKPVSFKEPESHGELLDEVSITPAIEVWHYSGGYWYAGVSNKLYDKDLDNNWNAPDVLAELLGIPVEFTVQLPDKVKEHIKNGGEIEVEVQFDNDYAGITYKPDKMFQYADDPTSEKAPRFKVNKNSITFSALPKFNCYELYYKHVPSLSKSIPKVKEGYGRNVYSIWDGGIHKGRALGTHTGEPEKIDYSYILNNKGEMEPGHIINIYKDYTKIG